MSKVSRRAFLKWGSSAAAMAAAPGLLTRAARAAAPVSGAAPILVVLRLDGGVDGLNTVVPAGFGRQHAEHYYTWRPPTADGLGVPEGDLLPLDSEFGLHPNLAHLKSLYDLGEVAVVHGVGYPGMDRSHFRGTEIMDSGSINPLATGVFGRYLDTRFDPADGVIRGVDLSGRASRVLKATRANEMIGSSLGDFELPRDHRSWWDQANRSAAFGATWQSAVADSSAHGEILRIGRIAQSASPAFVSAASGWTWGGSDPALEYGALVAAGNRLAGRFRTLSQLLTAASLAEKPQVFHLSLGGFDTHSAQGRTAADDTGHPQRLRWLSEAVGAFFHDLAGQGLRERVVLLTISEFGRTLEANGSRGTDHGTAYPIFAIGERVRGGLYGQHPSLQASALDRYGDPVSTTDFRSVYATILRRVLGADDVALLGADHYQAGLDFVL